MMRLLGRNILITRGKLCRHADRANLLMLSYLAVFVVLVLGSLIFYILLVSFSNSSKYAKRSRHVVITGGSSGIGKSLARFFVANECKVTLIARGEEQLKDCKSELDYKTGHQVAIISLDVTKDESIIKDAISSSVNKFGPVDVLIHSAGYAECDTFIELSLAKFRSMMEVHYFAALKLIKSILGSMIDRNSGQIVLISSIAGQVDIYGYSAYGPAKAAICALAETLRTELLKYNITVTTVFPPDTDTPGYRNENVQKPRVTYEISKSAGLYSPDHVASIIYRSIMNKELYVTFGLQGWVCKLLTSGTCSHVSILSILQEILLYPFLRLAYIYQRYNWRKLILANS